MMPSKPKNDNQRLERGAHNALQSTVYSSQPWWRAVGNDYPIGESTPKSSLVEHQNGSLINGAIQSQNNDGNCGLEHHIKSVPSSTSQTVSEHLDPNSQMELVGHSIVLTSYPYGDPQYGAVLTPYGPQTMVPPHLYGMHPGRMPLPLEMEDEPVYVNAKQYHGILRRRQSRAKAELEKKVIKARKPYLHESRHQHAMRRARGCGGRFLNTKKQDNSVANYTSEKGTNLGSNLSTQCASGSGSDGNLDSSSNQQEGLRSMVQEMQKAKSFSYSNGNGNGLSSAYHSQFSDSKEGDCLGEAKGIHWIQLVGKPSLWDISIPGNSFLAFRYSLRLPVPGEMKIEIGALTPMQSSTCFDL
ncbi:hypothetical protein FNV43_RR20664 [Rhamnella rubrinervis]|uniref:Nuclear transcription factor Y subunit n=1 Tax=Rhamnella rubrinervis TaxID=2594499 RepID=A0A8K0GUS7_9ROSA|nr:hypothetical protein FNV43_RR20664 [Rhamnella rubrinervis]